MDLQPFSQQNAPQLIAVVQTAPQTEETPKIEPAPGVEAAPQTTPEPRRIVRAWDEFVPEEETEPAGVYQAALDQDGNPVVAWDGDPAAEEAAEDEESPRTEPEEAPEEETANQTTMDTDKVDREIEALREETESLQRRLDWERNPHLAKALERKLAQAEQELARKDNELYRRRHAEIS